MGQARRARPVGRRARVRPDPARRGAGLLPPVPVPAMVLRRVRRGRRRRGPAPPRRRDGRCGAGRWRRSGRMAARPPSRGVRRTRSPGCAATPRRGRGGRSGRPTSPVPPAVLRPAGRPRRPVPARPRTSVRPVPPGAPRPPGQVPQPRPEALEPPRMPVRPGPPGALPPPGRVPQPRPEAPEPPRPARPGHARTSHPVVCPVAAVTPSGRPARVLRAGDRTPPPPHGAPVGHPPDSRVPAQVRPRPRLRRGHPAGSRPRGRPVAPRVRGRLRSAPGADRLLVLVLVLVRGRGRRPA